MAKKASAPPPPDDDAIAQALQKALSGEEVRLHGTAAAPGIFPSGNPGKALLEHAKAENLIDESRPAKPKAPRMGRITEKGRAFVLSRSSPRQAAEAMKAMLEAQGAALVERLAQAEHAARAALAAHQQTAQRLAELLREPPKAVSPPPAAWEEDLVRLVREAKNRNPSIRPTLPAIFDELRRSHPTAELAAFHDTLRRLHERGLIRLGAYSLALATLPDSRNALYLDREVKFYVDLP